MSGLVVVAIVLIVIAAALVVIAAASRRESNAATGSLSGETLKRDAKRRKAERSGEAAPGLKGREIERAAVIARTGQALVPASSTAPTVWVPPDPETYDVTRRQFLNRTIFGLMGFSITAFAAASFTAFLWPSGAGGFGSKIRVGKISDIVADIEKNKGFLYKPEGRMWITQYPASAIPKAEVAYKGQPILDGMKAGIVALYQKCPHLGCRVPDCPTSQWFECPCHGSQYNRVGEKKGGPARGMDRFAVEVSGDVITVNTGLIVQGPPIGTNTTGQEAEGPHCISGGEGHKREVMYAVVTTQRAIGLVTVAVVAFGALVFIAWTVFKGRAEVGSEIELAANRKEYLDDEALEGKKLNLALWFAVGMLALIALTLPLYWMAEPGRESGAVADYQNIFIARGLDIYENQAQCQSCHGPKGTGGVKDFVINDESGKYLATVNWKAPALDNVLYRFSQDEVKDILVYGRPGSPMPAWGTAGGGPLTSQQLDNVIDYLWSVQITPAAMTSQVDDAVKAADAGLYDRLVEVRKRNAAADPRLDPSSDKYDPTVYECPSTVGATATPGVSFACLSTADNLTLGEIIFNLESVASGAYACARCHVPGASYGQPWEPIEKIGTGRYGPNLIGVEYDLTPKQHYSLIVKGSEYGKQYGANHQGSGRMPGFATNSNDGIAGTPQLGKAGMLGAEEVWAIVVYERNLSVQRPDLINAGQNPASVPAGAPDPNALPVVAASQSTTTTAAPNGATTTTVKK